MLLSKRESNLWLPMVVAEADMIDATDKPIVTYRD